MGAKVITPAGVDVQTGGVDQGQASQFNFLPPTLVHFHGGSMDISAGILGVNYATIGPLPANTYSTTAFPQGALTANAVGMLPMLDGFSVELGMYVLVKNEPTQQNNGVYIVTGIGDAGSPWILTRAPALADGGITSAALVAVGLGATNSGTLWTSSSGTIGAGGDAQVWTPIGANAGLLPARVATTAPLPANTYSTGLYPQGALTASANGALPAIDEVSLAGPVVDGNRIVVKNEAVPANNGIYVVLQLGDSTHPWILTRAPDLADGALTTPEVVGVHLGTVGGGSLFMLNVNAADAVVGVGALVWSAIGGSAASGLTGLSSPDGSVVVTGAAPVPNVSTVPPVPDVVVTGAQAEPFPVTATGGAPVVWATLQRALTTFALPSNLIATSPLELRLIVQQDGSGSRAYFFQGNVTWIGDPPTNSVLPNAIDLYRLVTFDGGASWIGVASSTELVPVVRSGATTAKVNQIILADTSGGAWPLTLPSRPRAGTVVHIKWVAGTVGPTISGQNGALIDGAATLILTVLQQAEQLGFDGTNWQRIGMGLPSDLSFTDAANIFTQAQTGPFRDKGGAVYNVVAYGADPTGVLDSTTAAAAAYAAAAGVGRKVYWPPGTYLLSAAIALLSHTRTEMAAGAKIIQSGNNATFLGDSLTDVHFSGGEIQGHGSTGADAALGIFQITNSTDVHVEYVTAHSQYQIGWFANCTRLHVNHCNFYDYWIYGLIASQCADFHLDHNEIHDCTMANVYPVNQACYGIQATGNTLNQFRCTISFNHIYNVPGWDAIMSHDTNDIEIIGNIGYNVRNGIDLSTAPPIGTHAITNVVMVGNVFAGTATDAFLGVVNLTTTNGSTAVVVNSGTWASFAGAVPVSGPGIPANSTITYVDATHGTLSVVAGAGAGTGAGTVQYPGQNCGIFIQNSAGAGTTNPMHGVVASNILTGFCQFYGTAGTGGIVLQRAENMAVTGNVLWSNGTGPGAISTHAGGIYLNGSAVNVTITGNAIRDSGLSAVQLFNMTICNGVVITGNSFDNNGAAMVTGVTADSVNAIDCEVRGNVNNGTVPYVAAGNIFTGPTLLAEFGPSSALWHNAIAPVGATQGLPAPGGRVNNFRLNTTVGLAHNSGDGVNLTLASTAGVAVGDTIHVQLSTLTRYFTTTVASVVDGTHVTLAADLAGGTTAALGALVYIVRWLTKPLLDVQVFTGPGTFVQPTWARVHSVTCIGSGGGGGSGARGGAATARSGGAGGGGGAVSQRTLAAATVGATEAVGCGLGGTGGPAVTTDTTAGTAGNPGVNSTFGTHVTAIRGFGGGGGQLAAASVGGTAGTGMTNGGTGGGSPAAGGAGVTGAATGAASGGAGGGGVSAAGVAAAGAVGSNGLGAGGYAGGAAGAAGGGNGGNGTSAPANEASAGGPGGGGGGATGATPGGTGGTPGTYGAGGSGGGASDNGANSGAGSNGANGIVVVISW